MLTEPEAIEIYHEYITAKKLFQEDPSRQNKVEFSKVQNKCVQKFGYIVKKGARGYQSFSNHSDLLQEGYISLFNALDKFKEEKHGNIFWWLHRYIDTKIVRRSSKHNVVKVPMAKAENIRVFNIGFDVATGISLLNRPDRMTRLSGPLDYQSQENQIDIIHKKQISKRVRVALDKLSPEHKKTIEVYFDMDISDDKKPKAASVRRALSKLRKSIDGDFENFFPQTQSLS